MYKQPPAICFPEGGQPKKCGSAAGSILGKERGHPSTVEASITLARASMHAAAAGELGLPSSASCGTLQNMLRGLHPERVKLVLGESWGRQEHLSWPFNSKSQNRMIEPTCVFYLSSSVGDLNMFL